jgi:hypothetical protein
LTKSLGRLGQLGERLFRGGKDVDHSRLVVPWEIKTRNRRQHLQGAEH